MRFRDASLGEKQRTRLVVAEESPAIILNTGFYSAAADAAAAHRGPRWMCMLV